MLDASTGSAQVTDDGVGKDLINRKSPIVNSLTSYFVFPWPRISYFPKTPTIRVP
jgi:hypothetical protein